MTKKNKKTATSRTKRIEFLKKSDAQIPDRLAEFVLDVRDPEVIRRIGAEVRRVRLERGLSIAEVAARAEVSLQWISECERGGRRLTGAVLSRIAQAMCDPELVWSLKLAGRDLATEIAVAGGVCRHCLGSGAEPKKDVESKGGAS